MSKEKILSVFIDESGDFGQFDVKHPMYYVAMVMHDQSNDISANINALYHFARQLDITYICPRINQKECLEKNRCRLY